MKLSIFSTEFEKNTHIVNFTKIRQVGAEIFPCEQKDTHTHTHTQTEGQTGIHDEANYRSSHFCKRG